MNRKSMVKRIARALGASRVVPLGKTDNSPFGMLALTDQVRRLRSTGPGGVGRPADAFATLPRIVKFRPGTWQRLGEVALAEAAKTGTRVSPAQVAAILIDLSLASAQQEASRQTRGEARSVHRNSRENLSLLALAVARGRGTSAKRLAKG
ncbi:MAG: hypothetical protein AAB074_10520 [Planctomycetota bacterium]